MEPTRRGQNSDHSLANSKPVVPLKYQLKRTGFTLLELLVVVAILGVIGGLGLPAMINNYKKAQVNDLTTGLAGWLQEVRNAALKGSACTVEIKTETGAITGGDTVAEILEPPETCATPNNPYLLPESARGANYIITANINSFSFTQRASKYPREDVLITIAMADNGPARCIQLRGLFGHMEMGNVSSSGNCELTKF
jgi:prepilin-type N-terminal cleavage/methylation domain-containing protein